jgi:hypothetical protein
LASSPDRHARSTANQFRIADLTVFEHHADALIDDDEIPSALDDVQRVRPELSAVRAARSASPTASR